MSRFVRISALPFGVFALLALAACDPQVDRRNPYDPVNPTARCATLVVPVEGAEAVQRRIEIELDPLRPAGRCDEGQDRAVVIGGDARVEVADLVPGLYRVRASAAGHRPAETRVELGNGDIVLLDPLVLVDDADPVAPGLVVTAGPVRHRVIEVQVSHPEPDVRVDVVAEVGGVTYTPDVTPDADRRRLAIELANADGRHRLEVSVRDRADRRSPAVTAHVELDRQAPGGTARLSVVGVPADQSAAGVAEVDVRVLDADADATRMGVLTVRAAEGEVCAPTLPGCDCAMPDCPPEDEICRAVLPADRPAGGAPRITLRDGLDGQPGIGRYCVYGRLADAAGNLRDLPPREVDRPAVRMRVLGARADGVGVPVGARVEVRRDGRLIDTLDSDAQGAIDAADLTPGRHAFTVRADGYAPVELLLDLVMGVAEDLGEIVLVDATPPAAPVLALAEQADTVPGPSVDVSVSHGEAQVRVELALDGVPVGDVIPEEGVWPAVTVPLPAPDGAKRITAVAVDLAGNRSAPAALTVRLDTTPPAGGALRVAGGQPEVRGDNEVDVQVLDADGDAVAWGLTAVPGAACAADVCPAALPCDRPLVGSTRLVLGLEEGPYCVCGRLCDAVGNGAPLDPVAITLGPFVDRLVPVIDRLVPSEKPARPDADPWLCIEGRDLAVDTVADVGAFTSLACAPTLVGTPCDGEVATADTWGTVCAVRLPDALRLASGQHPVWLRTPAPVVDGAGRSLAPVRFTLLPPRPRLDRIEPTGVSATEVDAGPVEVRIDGVDLTLNVALSLAGRAPIAVERHPDPDAPGRVSVLATFDLSDARPRWETDAVLAVTNPGGDRIEVPFGVTPSVYDCPPEGRCTIPVRRTLPAGLPGHVQLVATMPEDGRTWSLQTRGGTFWSLLQDDAPPIRVAAELGWSRLPLPSPLPGALVVADVPAWAGGTVGLEPRNRLGRLPGITRRVDQQLLEGPVGDTLFVDLDLDGIEDMVTSHPSLGRVSLIVAGVRDGGAVIDLDGAPSALARGDIDGDGRPEIIVADDAGGPVTVLYTGPDGEVINVQRLDPPPRRVRAVAVADLDADRLPEIIAGTADGAGDGGLVAWSVRVDGRITDPVELDASGAVEHIITRDHSQDGVDDLLFGGPAGLHALVSTPGRLPTVGEATRLPVEGAAWFLLTETGYNGFEWLVVPGAPGACGLDDPTQACIQLVVGHPGPGWSDRPTTIAPVPSGFVGLLVADLDADGRSEVLGQMPAGEGYTLAVSEIALSTDELARTPTPFHVPFDDPIVGVGIEVPPFDGDVDNWALDFTLETVTAGGQRARVEPTAGPDLEDRPEPGDIGGDDAPPAFRAWADIDGDGWTDHIALSADGISVRSPNPAVDARVLLPLLDVSPRGLVAVESADGPVIVAAAGQNLWFGGRDGDWQRVPVGEALLDLVELGEGRVAARIGDAFGQPVDIALFDVATQTELGRVGARCPAVVDGATRLRAVFGAPDDLLVERPGGLWRVRTRGRIACSAIAGAPADDVDVLAWVPADLDGDGNPERVEAVLRPSSAVDIRILGGESTVGPDGAADWRFGGVRGEAIELRRVGAGFRPRTVLHVARANADAAPDVVVGLDVARGQQGTARQFWVRTLFGRAGGTLSPPAWTRPPPDASDDGAALALGVADATGEGVQDVIAARGDDIIATTLAATVVATLLYTEETALVDGRGGVEFELPGGWLDRLTVLAEFDGAPAPATLTVTSPRGDVVLLDGPFDRSTHWWIGNGAADPAAPFLGRQPTGRWRIEIDTPADFARISLLPGMFWERPRAGRAWDADGDGLPLWNDCDPDTPEWPPAECEGER